MKKGCLIQTLKNAPFDVGQELGGGRIKEDHLVPTGGDTLSFGLSLRGSQKQGSLPKQHIHSVICIL